VKDLFVIREPGEVAKNLVSEVIATRNTLPVATVYANGAGTNRMVLTLFRKRRAGRQRERELRTAT
jgi:hypothetical protein